MIKILPKISKPETRSALLRERIFMLFDRAESIPLVWVAAPPGSGKTTAVASYLSSRKARAAWLQVDRLDNDPAVFFDYLSQAIQWALKQKRFHNPKFGFEYRGDRSAFLPIYLRYLASQIQKPLKIVLDNMQELNQEFLAEFLTVAHRELPRTIQFIIISRLWPPAQLARLEANQDLIKIGYHKLRFTAEEVDALYGKETLASKLSKEDIVKYLIRQTDGWVSGLVLMRESGPPDLHRTPFFDSSMERVFDYFAMEVFEKAEQPVKNFLLSTAYLPILPLQAAIAVSNNPDAEKILEYLCKHNLFTYRKQRNPVIYEYHALFKNYLQQLTVAKLQTIEQQNLFRQSAQALNLCGFKEEAIQLFLQAQAWSECVVQILASAKSLLAKDQHRTLAEWIKALPENERLKQPWLSYWLGESLQAADDASAKTAFEEAYAEFTIAGDKRGQLLTSIAVLEGMHLHGANLDGIDKWCDAVMKMYSECESYEAESAARVAQGILIALTYKLVKDVDVTIVENIAQAALKDEAIDVNIRVNLARVYVEYLKERNPQRARPILTQISSLLSSPMLTTTRRVLWLLVLGHYLIHVKADMKSIKKIFYQAEELAKKTNLYSQLVLARYYLVLIAIGENQQDKAKQLIEDTRPLVEKAYDITAAQFYYSEARYELRYGRAQQAILLLETVLQLLEEAHYPDFMCCIYFNYLIAALLMEDRYAEAQSLIDKTKETIKVTPYKELLGSHEACQAYIHFKQGKEDLGLEKLKEGFRLMRIAEYTRFLRHVPKLTCFLCEKAIKNEVEVEHAQAIIAEQQLLPPQPNWDRWPWRIKLLCLGQFDLQVRGESKVNMRKRPQKLLDFLHVVLMLGGREVPINKLLELLWPGEGRVGAQNAFDNALFRLRKLLDDEDAIIVTSHRLSINPSKVWIDAWSVEACLDLLIKEAKGDLRSYEQAATKILNHYRGHFLANTEHSLRVPSSGEQLWAKVKQFLLRLGALRELHGEHEQAIAAYKIGIEHDALAQEFYIALLRVYLATGQNQLASDLYSACLNAFRSLVNKEPASTELRLIAEQLMQVST